MTTPKGTTFDLWSLVQSRRMGSPTRKCLMLLLARHANSDGVCWPGIERLALQAEVSEKWVRVCLGEFEEAGLVSRSPRYKDDGTRATDFIRLEVTAIAECELVDDLRPAEADGWNSVPPGGNSVPVPPEPHRNSVPRHRNSVPSSRNSVPNRGRDTSYREEPLKYPNEEPSPDVTVVTPPIEALQREFEFFWTLYPRKVAKTAARKAFIKATNRAPIDDIIEGVRRYASYMEREDAQFVAHAATWLNGDRWTDQDPPTQAKPANDLDRIREAISRRKETA